MATAGMNGPVNVSLPTNLTRDNVQRIWARFQTLRSQGATETSDPEFAKCVNLLKAIQQNAHMKQQAQMQKQLQQPLQPSPMPQPQQTSQIHTVVENGASGANRPTAFTPDQLAMLKNQIMAFKMISKNVTLPQHVQQAILGVKPQKQEMPSLQQAQRVLQMQQQQQQLHQPQPRKEEQRGVVQGITQTSIPSPQPQSPLALADSETPFHAEYETFTSPYTLLNSDISTTDYANRQQRLLIPSIMPTGIDVDSMHEAREAAIDSRMRVRIAELETLPGNIQSFDHNATGTMEEASSDKIKLKALIELKSLRLLHRQRAVRNEMVSSLMANSNIVMSANRASFRRMKKQSLREARLTEALERQQRAERERKERQKHLDYLQGVCQHGRDIINSARSAQAQQSRLGRSALAYHQYIEREELKRTERTAKQRLQALKANDEEGYLKLLDQAKDSRITHLLRQTDSFLDSLAAAVRTQQRDATERYGPHEVNADESEDEEGGSKVDYYAVAHRIQEEVTEQPKILSGGQLKDYQIKGLQWMVSLFNNNLNGILADEMGLGKTIQTISLITFLMERKRQYGPFLVIVPLSTLTNWTMEFDKWAPSVKKVIYKGPPLARKHIQQQIRYGNFQVLLTTYEYVIKDRPVLSKIKWTYMVVDEGHRMKNAQSKLTSTLTSYYYARYRLILSGTPLQNNLPELWSLLNFVLPAIFKSVRSFDEWFNRPFANTGGQDRMELSEEEGLLIIRRLHKVLRPFLLRRLKTDVESELPDKVEKIIRCQMSGLQAKLYQQMKQRGALFIQGEKGKSGLKGLSNTVMQLKKICNHPFVFEGVENSINPSRINNDMLWRTSGKFELLDRILPKFFRTGHRVLMFFQMTQIMNIMEDFLQLRGIKYLRLDGSTKSDDRSIATQEFNAPNSIYQIFLLSTRAGGLGLNLQTADTVVIFDSDWNPHQDMQAQDRAHRIGQTKEVRVLRLITNKSIEENILERAHYKLGIDERVIQAGKFDNKSTAEEREAFLRGLMDTDETENTAENDQLDDEELNEVIARSEYEVDLFREMDLERDMNSPYGPGKAHDRLLSDGELPDVYQYDEVEKIEEVVDMMGRGARERNSIRYDDGLTEEQWLDAMEDIEDNIEDASRRKRERANRRADRTRQEPMADGSEDAGSAAGSVENGVRRRSRKPIHTGEKRRREDEGEEGGAKNAKRAKSKNPELLSKSQRASLRQAMLSIVDAIERVEDANIPGRVHSELFYEVPSRKFYPDYYALIKKPIALDGIRRRINGTSYTGLDDLKKDLEQMYQNARTYNEPGSTVYEDANVMEAVMEKRMQELAPSGILQGVNDEATLAMLTTAAPSPSPQPSASPRMSEEDEEEDEEDEDEGTQRVPDLPDVPDEEVTREL